MKALARYSTPTRGRIGKSGQGCCETEKEIRIVPSETEATAGACGGHPSSQRPEIVAERGVRDVGAGGSIRISTPLWPRATAATAKRRKRPEMRRMAADYAATAWLASSSGVTNK